MQVRISTSRELGWPLQGRSPLDAEAMQKGFGRRPQDVSENLVHLTMWYHRPTSAACLMLQYGLDLHRDVVNPSGAQGAFRKDSDGQGYTLEYAIPWSLLRGAAAPTRRRDVWGLLAGPLGRRNRPRMEGTPGGHHASSIARHHLPACRRLGCRDLSPRRPSFSGHGPATNQYIGLMRSCHLYFAWKLLVGPSNRIAVSMRPPVNGSVSTFHRMETDMRDRTSRESVCFTSFAVMSASHRRSSSRLRSYRQLSKPLRPLLLSLSAATPTSLASAYHWHSGRPQVR